MSAALDDLYDPATAADWDAVGLVVGDPDAPVRRVLLAVDPVAEVVAEALAWGADLLLTHHPLLLRAVHGVAATTPKGRLVHQLVSGGCALHVAHTNADVARPGVSDALAQVLGLRDLAPLEPLDPSVSDGRGLGRVGELAAPVPLGEWVERVAEALPATAAGVRASGRADQAVRRVAVCGGAGDSLLDVVRGLGVDAYVTADLRHHPASEAREHASAPALVDVAHWASEWPWLPDAARRLTEALAEHGTTVVTRVSTSATDPWTLQARSPQPHLERGGPHMHDTDDGSPR